ncbi:MAG: hypothetical protein M0Z49_06995, partial [Chloroflexi bacterium]|nr:hypothetical protein [Chloroflexota bacterium]
ASVQLVAEDECAACSSLDGKVIAIAKATPIPLPGCERLKEGEVCPREWSPVVEWRSGWQARRLRHKELAGSWPVHTWVDRLSTC